jgi:hypothetical protein
VNDTRRRTAGQPLLLLVALATTLAGCGDGGGQARTNTSSPTGTSSAIKDAGTGKSGGTCLSLVNGTATTGRPAVGLILSAESADATQIARCTGTFVSDTTMLTAAHCVPSTGSLVVYVPRARFDLDTELDQVKDIGVRATGVVRSDFQERENGTDDEFLRETGKDMSAVIFPPGTAPDTVTLAAKRPSVGGRVSLVGFGLTHFSSGTARQPDDDVATKREGSNTLYADQTTANYPDALFFLGASKTTGGATASVAQGDSGGPMLDAAGALTGITSGGILLEASAATPGADVLVAYAALDTSYAASFFDKARAQGAQIPKPGEKLAPTAPSNGNKTACATTSLTDDEAGEGGDEASRGQD